MKTLAVIANLIATSLAIIASLSKGNKMKHILALVMFSNLLVVVGYILSGTGINGAISGILACTQTLINYFFEAKGKPVPKALIAVYILSFIVVNLVVGGISFYTFIAILACIAFIASILQKNGKNYRICAIANTVLWVAYDLLTRTYSAIITHGTLLCVSLIGFLVHDIKKQKKES